MDIKEYITKIGAVCIISAVIVSLLGDSKYKKYVLLPISVLMIALIISPISKKHLKIPVSFSYQKEFEKSEKEYSANILIEHRKNLENMIKEHTSGDVKVDTDNQGNLTAIFLGEGYSEETLRFIEENLGFKREKVQFENTQKNDG